MGIDKIMRLIDKYCSQFYSFIISIAQYNIK